MADRFRCNPQVAGELSQQLGHIRSDLGSLGDALGGSGQPTGSARIQSALHEFFEDSSDSRGKMSELLERASALLRGLSEGTTTLDRGLADALRPQGERV